MTSAKQKMLRNINGILLRLQRCERLSRSTKELQQYVGPVIYLTSCFDILFSDVQKVVIKSGTKPPVHSYSSSQNAILRRLP